MKFSPEASVITLTVSARQGEVLVKIVDQGPGVPDAEKDAVFKHFYRGDASRSSQGNGLGLSLAKAIVRQHQAVMSWHDGDPGLEVRVVFQPYQ